MVCTGFADSIMAGSSAIRQSKTPDCGAILWFFEIALVLVRRNYLFFGFDRLKTLLTEEDVINAFGGEIMGAVTVFHATGGSNDVTSFSDESSYRLSCLPEITLFMRD
jgi:hypothetical protein